MIASSYLCKVIVKSLLNIERVTIYSVIEKVTEYIKIIKQLPSACNDWKGY